MTECQIFSRGFFFFMGNKFAIGMFAYVAHFDRKVGIYIATKLFQFASRKEPYAILAGPDDCSRHSVRPSYGDFLNSFAMLMSYSERKSLEASERYGIEND